MHLVVPKLVLNCPGHSNTTDPCHTADSDECVRMRHYLDLLSLVLDVPLCYWKLWSTMNDAKITPRSEGFSVFLSQSVHMNMQPEAKQKR